MGVLYLELCKSYFYELVKYFSCSFCLFQDEIFAPSLYIERKDTSVAGIPWVALIKSTFDVVALCSLCWAILPNTFLGGREPWSSGYGKRLMF